MTQQPPQQKGVYVVEMVNWVVEKRKYKVDWENQRAIDKRLYEVTAPAPSISSSLTSCTASPGLMNI